MPSAYELYLFKYVQAVARWICFAASHHFRVVKVVLEIFLSERGFRSFFVLASEFLGFSAFGMYFWNSFLCFFGICLCSVWIFIKNFCVFSVIFRAANWFLVFFKLARGFFVLAMHLWKSFLRFLGIFSCWQVGFFGCFFVVKRFFGEFFELFLRVFGRIWKKNGRFGVGGNGFCGVRTRFLLRMHIFRVTSHVPFLCGVILTCTVSDDIISVSDVR